jgi:signal transduction histidine kinase
VVGRARPEILPITLAREVSPLAGPRVLEEVRLSSVPRVVCISTEPEASIVLQSIVADLVPDARVDAVDTASVRDAPDADCVVLSVGTLFSAGEAVARELRARGYAGGLVIVAEPPDASGQIDLTPLGIGAIVPPADLSLELPGILVRLLLLEERARQSATSRETLASLRRLQSLVAAGQLASRLQHRLNNPLAALLAEAQLLALEPMDPEQLGAVHRIVELCRRVIDVTRTIQDLEGAVGVTGMTGEFPASKRLVE